MLFRLHPVCWVECISAIRFVTKARYTSHHCDLYALVGWPSLHIPRQTHWLQVIYKSLLGKAPAYPSSLVTIAAPTRRTYSSRYISLVTPKANSYLGVFPSCSLLRMTGTNCKNHWSLRLISPSLTLSTSCQSSSQITAPVHSPSNYLIPILLFTLFILLLCSPVSLLAH